MSLSANKALAYENLINNSYKSIVPWPLVRINPLDKDSRWSCLAKHGIIAWHRVYTQVIPGMSGESCQNWDGNLFLTLPTRSVDAVRMMIDIMHTRGAPDESEVFTKDGLTILRLQWE